MGNLKPEFVIAVLTRSRDSLTAASGNPTMTTVVSPQPELTSTSTGKASIPLTAADKTRASMGGYWAHPGARAMRFLSALPHKLESCQIWMIGLKKGLHGNESFRG
jgi:hypothetical protein